MKIRVSRIGKDVIIHKVTKTHLEIVKDKKLISKIPLDELKANLSGDFDLEYIMNKNEYNR